MVEYTEHVVIRPDLFLTAGVFLILLLLWDLVKHLCKEEEEPGVIFNSVLEPFQCRMQFFMLVLVGIVDEIAEGCLICTCSVSMIAVRVPGIDEDLSV